MTTTISAPKQAAARPKPTCKCGGYVYRARDAVYGGFYYQCIECGQEVYTHDPDTDRELDQIWRPHTAASNQAGPPPEHELARLRWPTGVKCPKCHSSKVRNISPAPQLGYACDSCGLYFDLRTGSILTQFPLDTESWVSLLESTADHGKPPQPGKIASQAKVSIPNAHQIYRAITAVISAVKPDRNLTPDKFIAAIINHVPTATATDAAPITTILNLDQPALPFMQQDLHPVHIIASLTWPEGLTCPKCQSHQFHSPYRDTMGAFICSYCAHRILLREHSIFTKCQHAFASWLRALRILLTEPDPPDPTELAERAEIGQHTARSISERFHRAAAEIQYQPSPHVTVSQVSQLLNKPRTNSRGRHQRPNTPAITAPDSAEPSVKPQPHVQPYQAAKNPDTLRLAQMRWPDGLICPSCGSVNCDNQDLASAPQPFKCLDCKCYFSARTNNLMRQTSIRATRWIALI